MPDIINKARTKQRSLVITLLDLKKAFSEVHHNLIQTALDYHHIPYHIKSLVKSLWTDSKPLFLQMNFALRLYLLVVVYSKVIALAHFSSTCVF